MKAGDFPKSNCARAISPSYVAPLHFCLRRPGVSDRQGSQSEGSPRTLIAHGCAEKALTGETADHDSLIRDAAHIASAERPWPARTDLHATGAFRSKAAVAAVARALTDARARCSIPTGVTNDGS